MHQAGGNWLNEGGCKVEGIMKNQRPKQLTTFTPVDH